MTVRSKTELQNRLAQFLNDPDVVGNVSWLKAQKIMQFFDDQDVKLTLPLFPVHVGMELPVDNHVIAMWYSKRYGWCAVDSVDNVYNQHGNEDDSPLIDGLVSSDNNRRHPWPEGDSND